MPLFPTSELHLPSKKICPARPAQSMSAKRTTTSWQMIFGSWPHKSRNKSTVNHKEFGIRPDVQKRKKDRNERKEKARFHKEPVQVPY